VKPLDIAAEFLNLQDMLSTYFHDYPEEFQELSCDWSYTPYRCSHPCKGEGIMDGISILHGNFCTFMETGDEPMFRSVYQAFANTHLSSSVDLDDLVRRIKLGLDLQKNKQKTPCAEYTEFENLFLRRLQQKLRKQGV